MHTSFLVIGGTLKHRKNELIERKARLGGGGVSSMLMHEAFWADRSLCYSVSALYRTGPWLHLAYVLHTSFISPASDKILLSLQKTSNLDCRQMHEFSNGYIPAIRR